MGAYTDEGPGWGPGEGAIFASHHTGLWITHSHLLSTTGTHRHIIQHEGIGGAKGVDIETHNGLWARRGAYDTISW